MFSNTLPHEKISMLQGWSCVRGLKVKTFQTMGDNASIFLCKRVGCQDAIVAGMGA
jgi:hypothetical protein